jgi:hypothetical protein
VRQRHRTTIPRTTRRLHLASLLIPNRPLMYLALFILPLHPTSNKLSRSSRKSGFVFLSLLPNTIELTGI